MSIPSFLSLAGGVTGCVHPVVVFSILDHFKRRSNAQQRVVGTLLGERVGENIIIKNSFPVPHTEDEDQAVVDESYHRSMLALQKKVNSKLTVVGWYSTGNSISYVSSHIHEFYRNEVNNNNNGPALEPLLLTLDVSLENDSLSLRCYTNGFIRNLQNEKIFSKFEPANCNLIHYQAEKIGVDLLISGVPDDTRLDAPASLLTDFENLENAFIRLLESIETVLSRIQVRSSSDKNNNNNPYSYREDHDLGATLAEALSFIPNNANYNALYQSATGSTKNSNSSDENSDLFHNESHDLLMLVYLAQMTSTQINVADKIANLVL